MEQHRNERKTLDRALSRAGSCSRTQASEWIRAGRVRVAGVVVLDPGRWVDPARDDIRLDGRPLRARTRIYLALHKPVGYLTSRGDPSGRRTVYDLVGDERAWVAPVGRLDRDTSGLLFLTNDTLWAERITGPEHEVAKTYRAQVAPRIEEAALERLRAGLLLDDGPTRPAEARKLRDAGPTSIVELTITEGRNRQVRRMFRALGHRVRALKRVAIGGVELGELASGRVRPLTPAEVRRFRG